MAFIAGTAFSAEVKGLLSSEGSIDCAVAFWGKGAEKWLPHDGRKVRIVCNLALGGTNPAVIRTLLERNGVAVFVNDLLHAKVYLGEKTVIVGSANASTNGLGLEGRESAVLSEAGVLLSDADNVNLARSWFEGIVRESRRITLPTDPALAAAEAKFKVLRRMRWGLPTNSGLLQILHANPELLEDRDIYVIVTSENISSGAEKIMAGLVKNGDSNSVEDAYEDLDKRLGDSWTILDLGVEGKRGEFQGLYQSRSKNSKGKAVVKFNNGKSELQLVDQIKFLPGGIALTPIDKRKLGAVAPIILKKFGKGKTSIVIPLLKIREELSA
jgi:hypothetical protein